MQGKMQVRNLGEGRRDLPGGAGSRGAGKRVVQDCSTVLLALLQDAVPLPVFINPSPSRSCRVTA